MGETRTHKDWASWALAALWIAVAGATIISAALIAHVASLSDAPLGDEWLYTNPDQYLRHLFDKHNEHPFVIGRISLALDYWLADARGWLVRGASFIVAGGVAWAFVALGRAAGLRSTPALLMLGAFAAAAIYTPQGFTNFALGFQFTFVLLFAASAGAIAALAHYAATQSKGALWIAYVLGFIATQSLGNGILIPPLLLAMAWRLGLRHRDLIGFAILTVLSTLLFFLMPRTADVETAPQIDLARWLDMLMYGLRVLGGATARTLNMLAPTLDAMLWSAVLGAAGAAIALILSARALLAREPNAGQAGAAALVLFAIGTALLVGISRAMMAADSALTSRYAPVGALLISAIALLAVAQFRGARSLWGNTTIAVAAFIAALTPLATPVLAKAVTTEQQGQIAVQSAMVVGAPPHAVIFLHLSAEELARRSADLRAHEKWSFADQWSRAMGTAISTEGATACESAPTRFRRSRLGDGLMEASGEVNAASASGGRIVLFVDEHNVMQGYGRVVRTMGDILPAAMRAGETLTWLGQVRADSRRTAASYTIYLASPDRIVCRLTN